MLGRKELREIKEVLINMYIKKHTKGIVSIRVLLKCFDYFAILATSSAKLSSFFSITSALSLTISIAFLIVSS